MGCGCETQVRIDRMKRDRRVVFVPRIALREPRHSDADVVFTEETPKATRHGRAFVVCACEPGGMRIGGSTAVLWGKNDLELVERFRGTEDEPWPFPDRIVLVALYADQELEGEAIEELRELVQATEGRTLEVVRFADAVTLVCDPRKPEGERVTRAGKASRARATHR